MSLRDRIDALSPTEVGADGPSALHMARDFRSVRSDPLTFLRRMTEQYGDTVAFPVPGAPALLFNHPDHVRQILQTSARNWGKDTVQYAALARVTGDGLLASATPDWIEHRRAAAPAFHHERLAAVSHEVRTAARTTIAAHLDGRSGSVVDLSVVMHRVALTAVGRALFSADLSTRADDLLAATGDAADLVVRLGRSVLPTARWAPTRTSVRVRTTRRTLLAITAELIASRRARGSAGSPGDDLLGLLLDSGLSDRQISDELITMVIAGHETVAAALSWTLMLLAENPDLQQRVRREMDGRSSGISMLSGSEELPWTRACIDEALRLYPAAWAISRRSHHEEVVGDVRLPAGTLAIISPWTLHRRSQDWADPECFRPERFLSGSGRRTGYLPFGQGPRLCIGREFAIGEMVLVLDELLSRYRVCLPPHWTPPLRQPRLAVHPVGGMFLRIDRLRSA